MLHNRFYIMISRSVLLIFCFLLHGCYSFKGTSISPDLKSYYIEQTTITSKSNSITPADMPEKFMEALRAKIRNQSNLIYNDISPDIEFKSTITQYDLSDESQNIDQDISSVRKLVASINVEYISNKDEKDNWTQTFSHTIFFDPTTDFQSSEESFIDQIIEQITEQIFNKSFTNW